MQLKQLKAFCAVAQSMGFTSAVATTGLSQPTLSRLISQLEEQLGVELLDRYHRPLQLTQAGAFFYERITAMLSDLDTAVVLTQKMASPSTELNIGFVPSILYGLLPAIVSELKQQITQQHINLKDIPTFGQINALKTGEIDFGFGRFAINDDDILQILLRHERFVAALPVSHALASTDPISLPQLVDDVLILYHQTHLRTASPKQPSEPLEHLFSQHHVLPANTLKVSDIQVALGLVAAGLGVTLVPAGLQTIRQNDITYRPLKHENATAPIYLSCLKYPLHKDLPTLLSVIYKLYEDKGFTYTPYRI